MTAIKLDDQAARAIIRITGSILIALSVLILFADKVFTFNFENNYGYYDSQTFVWVLTQTLCPLIGFIGYLLKPYKISFLIPGYFLSIQLYWVFNPGIKFDDYLLQAYAVGSIGAVAISIVVINYIFNRSRKNIIKEMSKLEKALDLDATENIKSLIKFIAIGAKPYLKPESKPEYTQAYLNELKKITR